MRNQIASIGINQSEETYLLAPKSLYKGEPLFNFVEGNFRTAAQLLRRGNIVFALLYQGLKLADITSAVTVLKITRFTAGAEGVSGIDLQAIRSWQLIIAKYSH